MNDIADIFSAIGQAKRLRDEAAGYDALASAARRDGDAWDAAECEAKAIKLRRDARRLEQGS